MWNTKLGLQRYSFNLFARITRVYMFYFYNMWMISMSKQKPKEAMHGLLVFPTQLIIFWMF
jgi:hypothetical protein